jgi:hypothetical protein
MRGFFAEFTLSGQSEILRCAQDDSEWAQNDRRHQIDPLLKKEELKNAEYKDE